MSDLSVRIAAPLLPMAMLLCVPAEAEPVVLNFTGVLEEVVDTTLDSVLGGQFAVGDPFTGTVVYDDEATDGLPGDPNTGSYRFMTAPSSLSITIKGQTFSTDPGDVEFLVLVSNDYLDTPEAVVIDSVSVDVFIDKVVFPVETGPFGSGMGLRFNESVPASGPPPTAIVDDRLPTTIDVSAWDTARFYVSSDFGMGAEPWEQYYYRITGNIVSVSGQVQEVDIDIKPGSDPNCININGNGVIPVAILGSESLDVGMIDQGSLSLGGLNVRVRGNKGPLCGLEDTNLDGWYDLVCRFEDDADNWSAGSGEATLEGELWDGTAIEGSDTICVVP
jgi:hypothetical protein